MSVLGGLTIDNTEKHRQPQQPHQLLVMVTADDAEITIDIDQVGDGTAKGLKVTLIRNEVFLTMFLLNPLVCSNYVDLL